jgi:hypothetical protein
MFATRKQLQATTKIVYLRDVLSPIGGYDVNVTWPTWRRVKAQDGYLFFL